MSGKLELVWALIVKESFLCAFLLVALLGQLIDGYCLQVLFGKWTSYGALFPLALLTDLLVFDLGWEQRSSQRNVAAVIWSDAINDACCFY